MLYKSELQDVPSLPFPEIKRGKDYRGRHKYAVAASVVTLPHSGEVLIVDVFNWADRKFRLRFAANHENYLVAEYGLNEWSKKNPINLIDIYCASERSEDARIVREFLKPAYSSSCSSALSSVSDFIREYNAERRSRAAASKEALMEKHFAMYPNYPKNLRDYCDANVFDSYYLFISKIQPNGKRDARCSHCGKKFRIAKELKHNTATVCPKCGKPVICKGLWVRGTITEKAKVCIAANVDQQLLLRWVNVERTYSFPNYERSYCVDTYAYNLYLKSGKVYFYKLVPKPYIVGLEWYRGRLGDQCYDEAYIYADNLAEVVGNRYYKVDLQYGLSGKHPPFDFNALLNNLKNEPVAEYLFKMGLTRLASELHNFRYIPDDVSFKDLFGVGKEYVPMFREMNVSLNEVKVIKAAKCWVTADMVAQWRSLNLEHWRLNDVRELLMKMSFTRFLNYMTKQKNSLKKTGTHCLQLWLDYIRMSEALDIDLSSKSVLLPKNIKEAHDQLLEGYNAVQQAARAEQDRQAAVREMERNRIKAEKYKKACSDLYERMTFGGYSENGLTVVLPLQLEDLLREGQSLGHCVGRCGYDTNTINGISCIIFIRKEDAPETPFYTMEYDLKYKKIRQLYGKGNKAATPIVRAFAQSYVNQIEPRVQKEGKSA